MERIKAFELDISLARSTQSVEEYLKAQAQVKEQILSIREENKRLNKEIKDANKDATLSEEQRIQKRQELSKSLVKNEADLKKLTKEQRRLGNALKSVEAAEGSYDSLNAELNQLRQTYRSLGTEAQESIFGKEIQARISALDEELKQSDANLGQYFRNVGNYPTEVNAAISSIDFSPITDGLGVIPGLLTSARGAAKGLGTTLSTLAKNPVLALFTTLGTLLVGIIGIFTRTEQAQRGLAKASAFLSGVMGTLTGAVGGAFDKLSGFVGKIGEATSGIREQLSPLIEGFTTRLVGLISVIENLGKAFGALIQRDLAGVKGAALEAGRALNQTFTGVDLGAQSAVVDAIVDTTTAAVEQTNAYIALEAAQRAVRIENRELNKQLDANLKTLELNQLIADDTTKSFLAREQAAERAREAIVEGARLEIELAQNNLGLIQSEIALRRDASQDVQDLLDQETDAIIALQGAERGLTLAIANNNKERAELRQDRLEKDLDILIDGFDNQKTINERIIADDKRTLDERQSLLNETVNLGLDSFNKQIETIQSFTDVQVDANELLNESDAVRLNKRIRALELSEIIEGRLLEIIRDRRTAVQDLKEAQEVLNEATDQQKIVDIQSETSNQLRDLFNDTTLTATEIAKRQAEIETQSQRDILQLQINNAKVSADERAKLQEDLAKLDFETRQDTADAILQNELTAIELERIAREKAIRESGKSQEEKTLELEQLELESAISTNEARLRLEELSATDRANIELELIKLREEAAIESEDRIAQKRTETINQVGDTVNQLLSITSQFSEARSQKALDDLENQYERELTLAGDNEEERAKIEEKFDAKRAELEKQAFERQKKFARTQALINGALAITKILAETPKADFGIATAIQIALATATTAAQVATINSQQFAKGIVLKGDRHGQGGSMGIPIVNSRTGQPYGYAEDGEAIMTRKSTANAKNLGLTSFMNELFGGRSFGGKKPPLSLRTAISEYLGSPTHRTSVSAFSAPVRPFFNAGAVLSASQSRQVFSDADFERLTAAFAAGASQITPEVSVVQITNAQKQLVEVEQLGDL